MILEIGSEKVHVMHPADASIYRGFCLHEKGRLAGGREASQTGQHLQEAFDSHLHAGTSGTSPPAPAHWPRHRSACHFHSPLHLATPTPCSASPVRTLPTHVPLHTRTSHENATRFSIISCLLHLRSLRAGNHSRGGCSSCPSTAQPPSGCCLLFTHVFKKLVSILRVPGSALGMRDSQ